MAVNRYKPHVCFIPEDDADRQFVIGFRSHHSVNVAAIDLREPAGGWEYVLDLFGNEFIPRLKRYAGAHVVLVLDFDEAGNRRAVCERRIPDELKPRVFLIGAWSTPETLRADLNLPLDRIGERAAANCLADDGFWNHPHLAHNTAEVARMTPALRPILFGN